MVELPQCIALGSGINSWMRLNFFHFFSISYFVLSLLASMIVQKVIPLKMNQNKSFTLCPGPEPSRTTPSSHRLTFEQPTHMSIQYYFWPSFKWRKSKGCILCRTHSRTWDLEVRNLTRYKWIPVPNTASVVHICLCQAHLCSATNSRWKILNVSVC